MAGSDHRRTHWVAAALGTLCSAAAFGQVIRVDEIKACKVTCEAGSALQDTIWASNRDVTPAYWGRKEGDAVTWTVDLKRALRKPRLGVRYSYAAEHYRNVSGPEAARRVLTLTVDDGAPIEVAVPDTGWWDLFEMTSVALPSLSTGRHRFMLTSTIPHATTNLDCFVLYRGKTSALPPALRATQIAESPSRRFVLKVTPNAPLKMDPEELFDRFDRIYDHYQKYMGWAPPIPISIHLIENACWDSGATAFQNQGGVFFRADVMPTEQGNWCHEMTHMFYCAHFPGWFDESSVKMLTTFNWMPTLFPAHRKPEENPYYRQCVAEARAVLDNPKQQFDSPDPIQYALRVKYGPDVFQRFFHLCLQAGKDGEIDFTPGRHLTKDEIVRYMSRAAGEDVAPLYRQWRGFAEAP
jgi:hypothetical protein